ncbi:threonine-phosphate decarboxylase CobD [Xanthobacter sp. TB0139]|uniref:threonine-phosphate decarboxylase CobD n=1 Tax=Xanthobacter sp. TB0139 TaxID=3459178 RepID=UPI004038FCF5
METGETVAPIWHGGDIGTARRLFPQAPTPWVDLSTGINPVPYPVGPLPSAAFRQLPDPEDVLALEETAARAYGAADPSQVVAAPGTQVLISLLPYLFPAGRVAVLGPTYAEHALCWGHAGHEVTVVQQPEKLLGADVALVVNPNNPDGRRLKPEVLQAMAKALAAHQGWLVVDEAFVDFEPELSLVPHLPENAVVLRSFGKTYGLAGVRLGFAVTHGAALAHRIRTRLGPWAISGPALAVGQLALADLPWRTHAAGARMEEALRLDALMVPLLGAPVGGTALFRTFSSPRAAEVFNLLGEAGIFVRRFADDPLMLRLGLPGTEQKWGRLEEAVRAAG